MAPGEAGRPRPAVARSSRRLGEGAGPSRRAGWRPSGCSRVVAVMMAGRNAKDERLVLYTGVERWLFVWGMPHGWWTAASYVSRPFRRKPAVVVLRRVAGVVGHLDTFELMRTDLRHTDWRDTQVQRVFRRVCCRSSIADERTTGVGISLADGEMVNVCHILGPEFSRGCWRNTMMQVRVDRRSISSYVHSYIQPNVIVCHHGCL